MRIAEIQKIIVKFINKEAKIDELEKLDNWLENEGNTSLFNRFVEIEFLTAISMGEYDVKNAKEQINLRLKKKKEKRKLHDSKECPLRLQFLL